MPFERLGEDGRLEREQSDFCEQQQLVCFAVRCPLWQLSRLNLGSVAQESAYSGEF